MFKNLKLERPIAFIDVETTGLKIYSDKIVELSILKVNPDGSEVFKNQKINPQIPIPIEATAIHGITNAEVASEPTFSQCAKSILDFINGCDIGGFNVIGFDLPFLETEFTRAKVKFSRQGRYLIDSQVIYHKREPRDLASAYSKYCGKELKNAHSAEADAKASAEILDRQLEVYQDLPRNVSELYPICYETNGNNVDTEGKFIWVNGEAVCNFGKKYHGCNLKDLANKDPSYLRWITGADFSPEVQKLAAKALAGDFPKPAN
jgi:DNA polymerase-3 subunit epsilon